MVVAPRTHLEGRITLVVERRGLRRVKKIEEHSPRAHTGVEICAHVHARLCVRGEVIGG